MRDLELWLIRHEDAEDGDPDDYRALTPEGRRRMARTAKALADRGLRVDLVRTSPLVRAVQTAEIFATGVGVDDIEVVPAIAFPTNITKLIAQLTETSPGVRSIAAVGHEPTLSTLVMTLFPKTPWTGMKKGQVLAANYSSGQWKLRFLTDPKGPTFSDQFPG